MQHQEHTQVHPSSRRASPELVQPGVPDWGTVELELAHAERDACLLDLEGRLERAKVALIHIFDFAAEALDADGPTAGEANWRLSQIARRSEGPYLMVGAERRRGSKAELREELEAWLFECGRVYLPNLAADRLREGRGASAQKWLWINWAENADPARVERIACVRGEISEHRAGLLPSSLDNCLERMRASLFDASDDSIADRLSDAVTTALLFLQTAMGFSDSQTEEVARRILVYSPQAIGEEGLFLDYTIAVEQPFGEELLRRSFEDWIQQTPKV